MKSDPDRHVTRTGEDYAVAMQALLPLGHAWPRDEDSMLMRVVKGLTRIWGDFETRASTLLEVESDPRRTIELLPDWERNWGLPDPCYEAPLSVYERQLQLVLRMTIEGGASRAFFIEVAARLGYTITITEYHPWVVGLGRCGDGRTIGDLPPDPNRDEWGRELLDPQGKHLDDGELSAWPNYGLGGASTYYWSVHVSGAKLTWFRCGSGQCGVDPHLMIGIADDLECLLNRWKPAHTEIVFDYSGMETPDDSSVRFMVSVHQCGIDPLSRYIVPGTP